MNKLSAETKKNRVLSYSRFQKIKALVFAEREAISQEVKQGEGENVPRKQAKNVPKERFAWFTY